MKRLTFIFEVVLIFFFFFRFISFSIVNNLIYAGELSVLWLNSLANLKKEIGKL